MKPDEMRIAIAEACGWTFEYLGNCWSGDLYSVKPPGRLKQTYTREAAIKTLPDYLNDLNAMHEAEKTLYRGIEQHLYWQGGYGKFKTILGETCDEPYSATAAERAEAFLRTIGKYKK